MSSFLCPLRRSSAATMVRGTRPVNAIRHFLRGRVLPPPGLLRRCLVTSHTRNRPPPLGTDNADDDDDDPDLLPTFSTRDQESPPAKDHFIKTPNLDLRTNLLLYGRTNLEFPSSTGLRLAEVTPGCLRAVEVTTGHMARYETEPLKELMTDRCWSRAKSELDDFAGGERHRLSIPQEDVFLSWVASSSVCRQSGLNRLTFVTMSLPGYGELCRLAEDNNVKLTRHLYDHNMHLRMAARASSWRELYREINEETAKVVESLHDTDSDFEQAEMVVTNVVFAQDKEAMWKVEDIVIKGGLTAFLNVWCYRRWKLRAWLFHRGFDFAKVMRYDSALEYATLLLFVYIVASGV